MRAKTVVALIIAIAVAGALFAAFWIGGYSATVAPPAPALQIKPVNPVALLAAMHVPSGGEISGPIDTSGDQYASGTFADGEQVSVYTYTYTTAQAMANDVAFFKTPSPGNADKVLLGSKFIVVVTGVGTAFPEPPATLAHESGTVVD